MLVSAKELFGERKATAARYWVCRPCDAWVACHPFSDEPMGRLANKELRRLRHEAHRVFDLVWQDRHKRSRYNAYSWLSLHLGKPRHLVHIGYFDEEDCRKTIEICTNFLKKKDPERYASLPS